MDSAKAFANEKNIHLDTDFTIAIARKSKCG